MFNIQQVDKSRCQVSALQDVVFGKLYSDHMLYALYDGEKWQTPSIKPYDSMKIMPSISALHYGQSVFEGMKAYKNKETNKVGIFRIKDHFERINFSAKRLEMAEIPSTIFIEGMKKLVQLDSEWVPPFQDHSLYIRPFLFAADEGLGVAPSKTYHFMIIMTPVSAYYGKHVRVYVQDVYSRAARGGVGNAKAAGNYAASLQPTRIAVQQGFDQVLWTDAENHQLIQEVGTMNIFFVFNDCILTPSIENGTILNGITRRSAITLLREKGFKVEERDILISELIERYKKGELKEVFGTGTAVVINSVSLLKYRDTIIDLKNKPSSVAGGLKQHLSGIRYGEAPDNHLWMTWV